MNRARAPRPRRDRRRGRDGERGRPHAHVPAAPGARRARVFAAAWTVALIVLRDRGRAISGAARRSDRAVVEATCVQAQHELAALPQVGLHTTAGDRAPRVTREDRSLQGCDAAARCTRPESPPHRSPAGSTTGSLVDAASTTGTTCARKVQRAASWSRPRRASTHRRQDEQLDPRAGHAHRRVQHGRAAGRGGRRAPDLRSRRANRDGGT